MTVPATVLVHGGGFDARCWDRLVPLLHGPAHAVELPGRRDSPIARDKACLADFVARVVDEIVTNDLHDVLLVGHSLAGITLPGVMQEVPDRLRRAVFVSCAVPPVGSTVVSVLGELSPSVQQVAARLETFASADGTLDHDLATAMFCNDMDAADTELTLSLLVGEAPAPMGEPVSLDGLSQPVARTYIRLLRDESILPKIQQEFAARIGADVVDVDAGHMAMISRPEALAAALRQL